MTTKASSLFLSLCIMTTQIWAEEAKISLRTFQLGGGAMPVLYVKVADAKEPAKISWLSSQPTEPMEVVHDGSLKLLRQVTNPEGKETFELAATVKLPGMAKEVLLLVWESDGKAKYVAIEDRFLNAKFNDWMAINTSSNPVAILAGESSKPVRVEAGSSVIFQPIIEEGKGVKIIAQTYREKEVKTFLSSYWPAFEKQRTMIIFYDDGEKMRARRIGDRFLKKKEEPE